MADLEIQEFTELTEATVELLLSLEGKIFEKPLSKEIITRELSGRPNLSILVGYIESQPVGYKIGYEYHSDHEYFYSFSGGVVPEFRRQGIARKLMAKQHELSKAKGYKFIRTQTKNKYKSMLLLNIEEGFDITGVYKKIREAHHGVILEKEL